MTPVYGMHMTTTAHIRRPADGRRHGSQYYRAQASDNDPQRLTLCGTEGTTDDMGWADAKRKREVPASYVNAAYGFGDDFHPAREVHVCADCRHIVASKTTHEVRRAGKGVIR